MKNNKYTRHINFPVIILVMLTVFPFVYGQLLPLSPVTVTVKEHASRSEHMFVMEIHLAISEGVHVYTSEDQFFKVQTEILSGLGPPEVIIPETADYTNFDGSVVDVFHGDKPILVRFPFQEETKTGWKAEGYFQYQACDDITCYPPVKVPFSFSGAMPAGIEETVPFYKKGLFFGILFSFLAGLGLSLTPCVYPMVGITVAIIGSGSHSKKRTVLLTAIYVLGLSLVYGLVGVIIAGAGEKAHAASEFLRSAWVLVPIGIIFTVLGLSMFDIFTIQTPSSFAGKIQGTMGKLKGSLFGTFLMGGLSAFVVGPCISGPLLGLIIFVMQTGELLRGFSYFFALAWGMGGILFVAGAFSGALPKAGMWMERIKHILGIILIWAGFYFTRSLVGEAVFWTAGVVAFALGLNAAGLLQVPGSGTGKKGMVLSLAGILIFGIFVYNMACSVDTGTEEPLKELQLESILAAADRPVILDFTAPWCVNCKEIEQTVLSQSVVKEQLRKFEFVKVDFDTNPKLKARFNVIGPPAFIFLDKEGKQIGDTVVTGEKLKERLFNFQ